MLRKLTSVFILAAFLLGSFSATSWAGHRIQDNNGGTVSLESDDNDVPEQASGTVKFNLKHNPDGVNEITVDIKVNDLPRKAGRIYEVWLVDFDGNDLNLTAFNTDSDGNDETKVTRNIVNMAPYDRIVVTTKRRDSTSTSMSGNTVLEGRLH